MTTKVSAEQIQTCILRLLSKRQPGATICPSEAARELQKEIEAKQRTHQPDNNDNWRSLMQPVRDVATEMAYAGIIDITQKGEPINPQVAKGPIRLRKRST